MREIKTTKKKKSIPIGKIFIFIGAFLVIIGILYEVAGYPWRTVFEDSETINNSVLPKPNDIGQSFTYYYDNDSIKAEINTLPAATESMPINRPAKELVMLGNIKIPRIDLSENIIEGANDEILYAVGHLSGTPLPNEDGNFVVAGHRNYVWMHPFKHLDKMEMDDLVHVEIYSKDATTRYTYQLYNSVTVEPNDTWVLDDQTGESRTITLITCTPIPSYTHRLIFYGRLVSEEIVL